MVGSASADQQAPAEHALEGLAVAVALDAPARQGEVAGGLEVQVDAMAVGAQARLADGLVAPALEVLGEPENHRAALEQLLVALLGEGGDLAELGRALTVIAADLGDQGALAGVEAGQLG